MKAIGLETLVVPTDVSKGKEVEALAYTTYDTFEEVPILFNDAGVGVVGSLWECTEAVWVWLKIESQTFYYKNHYYFTKKGGITVPNGYSDESDQPHFGVPWWYLERRAPHLGHSKHLCAMAEKGADLETVKNLVRDAKFLCKKCGRAAAKEENLCEPIPL